MIPKFDGDTLGWEVDAGTASGGGSGSGVELPDHSQSRREFLAGSRDVLSFEPINEVPDTPGTSSGVGRVLTVVGENDQDYAWRDAPSGGGGGDSGGSTSVARSEVIIGGDDLAQTSAVLPTDFLSYKYLSITSVGTSAASVSVIATETVPTAELSRTGLQVISIGDGLAATWNPLSRTITASGSLTGDRFHEVELNDGGGARGAKGDPGTGTIDTSARTTAFLAQNAAAAAQTTADTALSTATAAQSTADSAISLPPFPASGNRDNMIPKFDGDILGWEEDAGTATGDGGGSTDLSAYRTAADQDAKDSQDFSEFGSQLGAIYATVESVDSAANSIRNALTATITENADASARARGSLGNRIAAIEQSGVDSAAVSRLIPAGIWELTTAARNVQFMLYPAPEIEGNTQLTLRIAGLNITNAYTGAAVPSTGSLVSVALTTDQARSITNNAGPKGFVDFEWTYEGEVHRAAMKAERTFEIPTNYLRFRRYASRNAVPATVEAGFIAWYPE